MIDDDRYDYNTVEESMSPALTMDFCCLLHRAPIGLLIVLSFGYVRLRLLAVETCCRLTMGHYVPAAILTAFRGCIEVAMVWVDSPNRRCGATRTSRRAQTPCRLRF